MSLPNAVQRDSGETANSPVGLLISRKAESDDSSCASPERFLNHPAPSRKIFAHAMTRAWIPNMSRFPNRTASAESLEIISATRQFRRLQNQNYMERITRAAQMLANAQKDAELAARLAAPGYAPEKIAQGLALQQSAHAACLTRQRALAGLRQAKLHVAQANLVARRTCANVRMIARTALPDDEVHTALELRGHAHDDLEKFVRRAREIYDAVLRTPAFLEAFAGLGFSAEKIQTANATLDALVQAHANFQSALTEAKHATAQRDQAIALMEAWSARFQTVARVALRNRQDLEEKLSGTPLPPP
jgi:hypothetical protein